MAEDRIGPVRRQVAVVGGGIAGAWLAYRLARNDIPAVLISADACWPPLSRAWAAGLMSQSVIDCDTATAPEVFADSSTTQDPGYQAMMVERVGAEFAELSRLVEYQRRGDILHPAPDIRLGAGDQVVGAVLAEFTRLGGTTVRGRVTDLAMDGDVCLGLRYDQDGLPGRILCDDVVLATGGFSGLFADGVGTSTGSLQGTYARNGGRLANLELFKRFALGDLDRKRPLYPFDLEGARLLRAGAPATELMAALDGDDLQVFVQYWTRNLDVPHTAELAGGTVRLGPIKGFSMGGMAPSLPNVHSTGECGYGLSVDSITGKPFASFLSMGAALAETLAARPNTVAGTDFDAGQVPPPADMILLQEIRNRLAGFQDTRFFADGADGFARWCERERHARDKADTASTDTLILAEAYARSAAAREESRGFFHRADFPETDPAFDNRITVASLEDGRVTVSMAPTGHAIAA